MKSSMVIIMLFCGYCSLYAMEKPTTLDLELFKAIEENKLADVETLLAQRANPNAPYEENFTPLHVAAEKGHTTIVELLLTHNADINAISKKGCAHGTALHMATGRKNIPLIELLIRRGADLSIRGPYNLKGTALHIAAYKSNRVIEPFISLPSVKVMNQARLLAKDSLIPCLIPLIVDEQLKELKKLFKLKMNCLRPSDVAYLSGKQNNKFYEIAEKLDPKKVVQHHALITQSVTLLLTKE